MWLLKSPGQAAAHSKPPGVRPGTSFAQNLIVSSRILNLSLADRNDVAPSQVEVSVTSLLVDGVDYCTQLKDEREDRDQADALAARARERQKAIAVGLNGAGVPLREIAGMLGLSHERVQQLIAASTRKTSAA